MNIDEFDKVAVTIMKAVYSHPQSEPGFTQVEKIFTAVKPTPYEVVWGYLKTLDADGWLKLDGDWSDGKGFSDDLVTASPTTKGRTFAGRHERLQRAFVVKHFVAPFITGVVTAVVAYLLSR
ncbi:hypothetical protein [Lacticaseibacillus parakribbianus]|uniref:hypothetical protein n=1 Tax=Lacticaseibacillus parakribbianus TaxID=2970927 RepID=UPI0021CAF46C|nr:hypothetical protein [Lacticaseibacillus parakribbianus]